MKIVFNCQDELLETIWRTFPDRLKARFLESFIRCCLMRGCGDILLGLIGDDRARQEIRALLERKGFPLVMSPSAMPAGVPAPAVSQPQPVPRPESQQKKPMSRHNGTQEIKQAADNRPKVQGSSASASARSEGSKKEEVRFDWMEEMYAKLNRMMSGK